MQLPNILVIAVASEADVAFVATAVVDFGRSLGMNLIQATKLGICASELASNQGKYAKGGGEIRIEVLNEDGRLGARLIASDRGPGIADTEAALKDGESTSGSLGSGLPAVKRFLDKFELINSKTGVTIKGVLWVNSK